MRATQQPIRTTILGGLIFLIPFGILLAVSGKVYRIMEHLAAPLSAWMSVDRVGGVAVVNLVAIGLMILICWLAGLIATTPRARAAYRSVDDKLLNIFPRYVFVKGMAEGLDADAMSKTLRPVLVQFDDLAQLGFEIERDTERVVVYLPGSPDPWSGSTAVVTPQRVLTLAVDPSRMVRSLRAAGRGTIGLLAQG